MAKVIIGTQARHDAVLHGGRAARPVTVIQAGPCPVVAGQDGGGHGYDAVQLAFDEVPERKLSKPERGHCQERHRAAPHLHEFRGAFELAAGEVVTVEGFEPGDAVKVSGRSKGKGFAGTIKRHGFSRGPVSHGSHNVRAPGSIGQSATPSRVIKGMRMAGHMGDKQRHAARAAGRSSATPSATCCWSRAPFPGPTAASCSCGRIADGQRSPRPTWAARANVEFAADVFGARDAPAARSTRQCAPRCSRAARARPRPRRAARWPAARAKPWRQKGTGRARAGTTRAPHWTGGGVVFGPHPRDYSGKMNRKARAARQADRALAARRARSTRRLRRRARSTSRARRRPRALVAGWGQQAAARRARGRGRGDAAQVVPQPRARDRRAGPRTHGRRAGLGAQPARLAGRAGRAPGRCRVTSVTTDPRHVILEPGRLGEEPTA